MQNSCRFVFFNNKKRERECFPKFITSKIFNLIVIFFIWEFSFEYLLWQYYVKKFKFNSFHWSTLSFLILGFMICLEYLLKWNNPIKDSLEMSQHSMKDWFSCELEMYIRKSLSFLLVVIDFDWLCLVQWWEKRMFS